MKTNLATIVAEIEKAQRIGLMPHINADGDAFGSMLGLRDILRDLEKEVVTFCDEEILSTMGFVPDAGYLQNKKYQKVDTLILLDTSVKKRVSLPEIVRKAQNDDTQILVIDHHEPGDIETIADYYYYNEEASSTAEIIVKMADMIGIRIGKRAANFLLFGLETDTNFLKNDSTRAETMAAKAELLKRGAGLEKIRQNMEEYRAISNLKFLGEVLKRIKLNKKYGIAVTYVTLADEKKYHLDLTASSEIATYIDQMKEAKVVIVLKERENGTIKVSMRSNNSNVDVAKLASFFGGGGHIKAAGFEVEGKIEDFIKIAETA